MVWEVTGESDTAEPLGDSCPLSAVLPLAPRVTTIMSAELSFFIDVTVPRQAIVVGHTTHGP